MRILLFITIMMALFISSTASATVILGIDTLINENAQLIRGKHIGIITNQTGLNGSFIPTEELLKQHADRLGFNIVALFSPEHGFFGASHAEGGVSDGTTITGVPIYSLYGATRRPSQAMLEGIDILIYDIQDIGSRSYTYISTLFYAMEEAAKYGITVIVTDRPNPINGITVDGPMLDEQWRSFVGYIDIPYCHGMTIGELALFFNKEYNIGCDLTVIPMKGWKRSMSFNDTGLLWTPTSPHIPESDTPFYYPTTGIIGELGIVNIGVGYTMPFKILGAPWIDAERYASKLNDQKFSGVYFQPFHFTPFYGKYKDDPCHGIRIVITDKATYKPVETQYLLLGMLKTLYPKQFNKAIKETIKRKEMFCKVSGSDDVYTIMTTENYITWKLISIHSKRRDEFKKHRTRYLIPAYS